MIELAPNRKQGLALANPLVAASGSVGYANEASDLIALNQFGALVTPPVSLRPRRGSAPPRLVAVRGGLVLNHGAQNAGWPRVAERHGGAWARSKAPIIAHVVGHTSLGELARRVEGARGIAALEYNIENEESVQWFATLRRATELPLLARVPYRGVALAMRAVEAGADALVCIAPPHGAAMDVATGQMVEGGLFGPLVKPLAMQTLVELRRGAIAVPLIACGGVHSRDDVDEFLAAGASAVMIDSLAWVDPKAVNELLKG